MLYPGNARILLRAATVNDAVPATLADDARRLQLLGYPEPGRSRLRADDPARTVEPALGSTDRRGHQRQRRSHTREQGLPLRTAIRLRAGRRAGKSADTSPPSTRARARARDGGGNQRPWPADKVERWSIDRLIAYARNARTHTEAQVAAIAASIKEWGWTTPAFRAGRSV